MGGRRRSVVDRLGHLFRRRTFPQPKDQLPENWGCSLDEEEYLPVRVVSYSMPEIAPLFHTTFSAEEETALGRQASSPKADAVAAFAAGQARLRATMLPHQRRASERQAMLERRMHVDVLNEAFGRQFVRRSLRLVEPDAPSMFQIGGPAPVPSSSIQHILSRSSQCERPLKCISEENNIFRVHITAWSANAGNCVPLDDGDGRLSRAFRLTTQHSLTEDVEMSATSFIN